MAIQTIKEAADATADCSEYHHLLFIIALPIYHPFSLPPVLHYPSSVSFFSFFKDCKDIFYNNRDNWTRERGRERDRQIALHPKP